MKQEIKIREVCGDWTLDIPNADNSVYTMYFNSRQNALNVKRIIETDKSNPNYATVCDMKEIIHGKNVTAMNPVDEFICSECGFDCVDYNEVAYDEDREYEYFQECEFNYCPHCGAEIDKEVN